MRARVEYLGGVGSVDQALAAARAGIWGMGEDSAFLVIGREESEVRWPVSPVELEAIARGEAISAEWDGLHVSLSIPRDFL